ncbi:glutaredoxin [Bacillus sp. BP-3]|nr:glutaredoxin [Bacillus sp. BP-3]MDC2867517.1 glutaredoxin [Bacillus sp. BP-3]
MFSKNNCPNCKRAKFMLQHCPVEVDIEEINADELFGVYDDLKEKGIMSLPSFYIDEELIEGFNEGKIMTKLGL